MLCFSTNERFMQTNTHPGQWSLCGGLLHKGEGGDHDPHQHRGRGQHRSDRRDGLLEAEIWTVKISNVCAGPEPLPLSLSLYLRTGG